MNSGKLLNNDNSVGKIALEFTKLENQCFGALINVNYGTSIKLISLFILFCTN